MALNEAQIEWLSDNLPLVQENEEELSDWERSFMSDQFARFEQYGSDMSLSAKQWAVIFRVADKLGVEVPDEVRTRI